MEIRFKDHTPGDPKECNIDEVIEEGPTNGPVRPDGAYGNGAPSVFTAMNLKLDALLQTAGIDPEKVVKEAE